MPPTRNYPQRRPLGHGVRADGGGPAVPRDAGSLVVWRDRADGPEVLMGRRSKKAAFVPDFFVFPGGRLDDSDAQARPATALDERAVSRMGVRGNAGFATALAMTAVRETAEETGLVLAAAGDVGAGEHEGWQPWRARGLAPDLAPLAYFGRAITSVVSPIRFHARFFAVRAERLAGELGGSGELSDLAFYPVKEALGTLPVVDVTEFMLNRIWTLAHDPRHRDGRTPLFAYREDRPFVTWE